MRIHNVHTECPAKTTDFNGLVGFGISVFAHCLITGIVARTLVKHLPADLVTRMRLDDASLFIASHDIGKISPGFYYMLEMAVMDSPTFKSIEDIEKLYVYRHEQVSAEWIAHERIDVSDNAEAVLACIRYHHGTLRECAEWTRYDNHSAYGNGEWDTKRKDVFDALNNVFGDGKEFVGAIASMKLGNEGHAILNQNAKYVAGFLCVCDHLASSEEFFPPKLFMGDELDIDLIERLASDAINASGLNTLDVLPNKSFTDIFPFEPNALQKEFANVIDHHGVYILEGPMGIGKTEAALYASYCAMNKGLCSGIYFALPTQLTSNSMFGRYQAFTNKISNIKVDDVRLVHGKAVFSGANSGMRSWFKGNKRGLLAQYALGTIDQPLMSVLGKMKHFFLRSYGLANKCVIFDELHSYDVYMQSLTKALIDQLIDMKCVVIVLSATLTAKTRGSLVGEIDNIKRYPLITRSVDNSVSYHVSKLSLKEKRVNIRHHNASFNSRDPIEFINTRLPLLEEAVVMMKLGRKVLWIENTVKDSQMVYDWMEARIHRSVGLLNSKFTSFDRSVNEELWVDRYGKHRDSVTGYVLVSTQVCEQSIDIDADWLVTAMCPTDMLLQRLGRLFRHDRNRSFSPECVILEHPLYGDYSSDARGGNLLWEYRNAVGSSSFVYHPYVLRCTYATWKDLSSVNLPSDIRTLLEQTYDSSLYKSDVDQSLKWMLDREVAEDTNDANRSRTNTNGSTDDDNTELTNGDDVAEHGTRKIGAVTVEVVLMSQQLAHNEFVTIYGDVVKLVDRMSLDDQIALNKASIRVNGSDGSRACMQRVATKSGRNTYTVCVMNAGLATNPNGSLDDRVMYDETRGLVIRS